jgi:beta-exotoxin I transport system permease protein
MNADATRELVGRGLLALQRSVLWWTLGIAALLLTTAAAWPSLEGSETLESFDEMGAILEAVGATDLATPSGYLDGQMYAFMLPLLLAGMAVASATGSTAGDEDAGRLELLHALPVSRRTIWLSRFAATAIAVLSVAGVAAVGMAVLRPLFSLEEVAAGRILVATSGAAVFALFCAAVGYAAGGAGASRGRAAGIAVLVVVGSYVMAFIAPLADALAGVRAWSPWHWALGEQPVSAGLSASGVVLVAVLTVVLVVAGTVAMERRDIRGV